jgi:CHAT domain-containing protein
MMIGRGSGELRTWSSDLFALADPINPLYERLPSTAVEVKAIAGLFKAERVRLYFGEQATRSKLLDTDFSGFRFLHFATHGQIVRRSGVSQPALVVSAGPKETSSLVSIADVLALKINADLVVLSACNTGYGQISKSEGAMNLGRAFLSQVAISTAVSLWPVSDDSTADLMTEFYRQVVAGKSKSEALEVAREKVRRTKQNPFFWAAFILVGD